MTETLETPKMLVLSTAHISESTNSMLTITDVGYWPISGGPYGDYGWFLNAGETTLKEVPDDLKACMQFARKNGCDYLLLDRDADTTEELPTYEW